MHTREGVRTAVGNLAKSLPDAYDRILTDIFSQEIEADRDLAKGVLSWISYSKRPLSILEVQCALAVELGCTNFGKDNLPREEIVESVCAGLVSIDPKSKIIRFVHETAEEYVKGIREITFPEAEENIARTCLKYISFSKRNPYTRTDVIDCLTNDPFLAYSSRYWGEHARVQEKKCQDSILRLVECKSQRDLCFACLVSLEKDRVFCLPEKGIPQLHFASAFGLTRTVERLIWDNVNEEVKAVGGYTALHWAASFGHAEVVELLLGHMTPNMIEIPDNYNSETALHYAAQYGHETVVELFLIKGANYDARNVWDETALDLAKNSGYPTIVKLFEKFRAKTVEDSDRWNNWLVAKDRALHCDGRISAGFYSEVYKVYNKTKAMVSPLTIEVIN
jgi:hypothetical protein